jgi:hypothetical protein
MMAAELLDSISKPGMHSAGSTGLALLGLGILN